MLSVNYIREEQNYYEQKIKELIEKDEYNIRRNQRQQKEIERLNNIIDKAIEYINNCEWEDYPLNTKTYHKLKEEKEGINLLNILKEGNTNE